MVIFFQRIPTKSYTYKISIKTYYNCQKRKTVFITRIIRFFLVNNSKSI